MGLFRKKQEIPQQPTREEITEQVATEAMAPYAIQEALGSDRTSFADMLYSAGPVPGVIENFPIIKNKVLALTNIADTQTLDWLVLHIDNMKSRYKFFTPIREQNEEIVKKFNELRFYAITEMLRSMGNDKRDRALWHSAAIHTDRPARPTKKTLFGKITGGD